MDKELLLNHSTAEKNNTKAQGTSLEKVKCKNKEKKAMKRK